MSKPITHDQFFNRLASLFDHRRGGDHGAIFLTQKRFELESKQSSTSHGDLSADTKLDSPCPLLLKATNGNPKRNTGRKIRLSTVVEPHDLETFYVRYADVCKAGMVAMKPRDRSKKKAKAKKKKTTG